MGDHKSRFHLKKIGRIASVSAALPEISAHYKVANWKSEDLNAPTLTTWLDNRVHVSVENSQLRLIGEEIRTTISSTFSISNFFLSIFL